MTRVTNAVEELGSSTLWINGQAEAVTMIWVSESHAELIVDSSLRLQSDQLTALVIRGFLSLPMRVEVKTGGHVVLRFVQRPHPSVIEVIVSDLLEANIAKAREALEENAKPLSHVCDLEAWEDQSHAGILLQRALGAYHQSSQAA